VRQALELETLASVLRAGGHGVQLVHDCDAFGVSDNVLQSPRLAKLLSSPRQVVRRILASSPELLLFSVLPGSHAWAHEIARGCKQELDAPVVFLGLHPTLAPERAVAGEAVDCVIQGETENVVLPLLEALASGREPRDVPGLWYRARGEVVRTPAAALVDLDALPLPDKDLFSGYASSAVSYAAMLSRGCPQNCSFCEETCAKRLHGPRYFRRRSVDSALAELAWGKHRYGFREVLFKDSYLTGSKRWLRELMHAYRREIGVPFKCFCTIQGFDAETARLLAEGGCYSVEFGLQTWNPGIRREVLGRHETNQAAVSAFLHCADHGLWYDVDHMFGLPGETERDHIEGALAYRRLPRLNRVKVHQLVYLPTAPIVDCGVERGALPDDVRDQLADGHESDFYDLATGSCRERQLLAGYTALYKLLPALPSAALRWLLQRSRARNLRHVPAPVVAAVQGLLALRSGDRRFLVYLVHYPQKLARASRDRCFRSGDSRRTD
jgi:hypothetical protein